MRPLLLRIDQRWDGAPVPDSEAARVQLSSGGEDLLIAVDAPYAGDPPPAGPAGPTDRLWEYEVVEFFVLGEADRYTEVELSPHGHHLVLRLEGRRKVVDQGLPMRFEARIEGGRWRGVARLPRTYLPSGPHRVNAYAIRGTSARRRYWAHAPVPGPAPDFHRLEHFVPLELP